MSRKRRNRGNRKSRKNRKAQRVPDAPLCRKKEDRMCDTASVGDCVLLIASEGPIISMTNFFESEICRNGLFYVSISESAVRVLLPEQMTASVLTETRNCSLAILTQCVATNDFELMFEDNSPNPFCLLFNSNSIDRIPPASQHGRTDLRLSLWGRGPTKESATPLKEMNLHFRTASRIPYLKQWTDEGEQ